ncbi:MAG: hypothetical protein ABSG02_07225 [Terriglobales bacterium]
MADSQPRIIESYQDYKAPFDAARVARSLLQAVPKKYLVGLDSVVLLNEGGLSRRDRVGKVRSRKRKVDKSRIYGRYHYAWKGKPAWIEIRVDKTFRNVTPKVCLWIPFFREILLGNVLYHELGHHIDACIRPEYREKEDIAEDWKGRLTTNFLRTKYWYAVWPLVLLGKIRKWRRARQLARG